MTTPSTASPAKTGIDYFAGFSFLFRYPNWGVNLLMGGLFTLIPIVGPLVLIGWYCEVFQRLVLRHPNPLPKLDFNDFVHLLGRGVVPFVVALVITLPLVLLIMVFFFAIAFIVTFFFGNNPQAANQPGTVIMMVGGGILVFMAIMVPMVVITNAALTRAYMTENFGQAFDIKRVLAYAKRTWKYVLLAYLVYLPVSILGALVGMMALYFGIFFVSFILNLAWIYMAWQIYEVYLSEGGEPIPIRSPRQVLPSEQPRPPLPSQAPKAPPPPLPK